MKQRIVYIVSQRQRQSYHSLRVGENSVLNTIGKWELRQHLSDGGKDKHNIVCESMVVFVLNIEGRCELKQHLSGKNERVVDDNSALNGNVSLGSISAAKQVR